MLTLQPVTLFLLLFTTFISCNGVVSDPQTNLLNSGCFQYNRFDPIDANSFNQSLNAAFGDLRDQIANQSKHVAKAQQASGATPVFALFQCRSYLSVADCVACFTVAVAQIRNCSANAARVIYDGCFLRYESSNFFEQATGSFNSASCGNQTPEVATTTFNSIIRQVLMNLQTETPRITGFSAATKTPEVPDNNNINTTIYAYAQCTETISQSGCEGCLKQGYDTMQTCLPNSDGRAFDAGCFIRYSTTSFFPDNLTIINTTPLSKQGSRSNKAAIIGGVAGGGVALFLVLLSLFAWMQRVRRSEKIERVPRGSNKGSLSWKQRYDIILGIARGLTYLHEEFHICIIHRDIKTNNILLDDDFQPKIADFGLARLLPQDQTHLSTRFAGTLGYTAPEYTIHGQLSEKADTYSYGIIVLEIISGQKNSELKIDDHADGEFLLQQAWKLYEKGMHLELVDNTLNPNEYDTEEVKKIIEISLLCTQASPAVRPTMSEVVVLLQSKGLSKNKIRPTMPFFVETDSGFKADTSSYTASSKSNATISTSTMISARS
ncbi:cysteine-rich receptor-like protein kinase 2 isoform X3 [Neltuma alba]|uniref:cysteine-rich receptor-like protein kinase 2 isoform X3 n=1 Tax=Neltuma alba TaxID=207710 RepID=UPI0010A56750|nr:cysteine-rich receptor-like protein kinase 2 isoform X3 [Prosopis alba]